VPEIELPDPHELAGRRGEPFTRRVALVTALYAVALAIAALGGNSYGREMLLAQQKASDQWAFYQARSIREHQYRGQKLRLEADLADRGPAMRPEGRRTAEELLRAEAERFEHERERAERRVLNFEYAEVLLQISIVLASVSILAVSRLLFSVSVVSAVAGVVLTLNGFELLFAFPLGH